MAGLGLSAIGTIGSYNAGISTGQWWIQPWKGFPGGAPAQSSLSISKFNSRMFAAIDEFVNEASVKHPVRGYGKTFWKLLFQAASQDDNTANGLLVAMEGDKIMGIQRVQNGRAYEFPNALRLMDIEALSSRAATALIKAAAQEALARGFDGMYGFATTPEGRAFDVRHGGTLLNPDDGLFYWDMSAINSLLGR